MGVYFPWRSSYFQIKAENKQTEQNKQIKQNNQMEHGIYMVLDKQMEQDN